MPKGQMYVRTSEGEAKFLPSSEAVEQFLSRTGYRITIELDDGGAIILRRDCEVDPEVTPLDEWVVQCRVTIREGGLRGIRT